VCVEVVWVGGCYRSTHTVEKGGEEIRMEKVRNKIQVMCSVLLAKGGERKKQIKYKALNITQSVEKDTDATT